MEISTETLILLVLRSSDLDDRVPLSITRIHFGTASKLFGTASMLFGSAPLNADLGGEPGGARHALPRILKLLKTCSLLLVVISLLEAEISHEGRIVLTTRHYQKILAR